MLSDITYCISPCPFKDCERHGGKIKELTVDKKKYISVADFAPICRKYISQIIEEVTENERKRNPSPKEKCSEET